MIGQGTIMANKIKGPILMTMNKADLMSALLDGAKKAGADKADAALATGSLPLSLFALAKQSLLNVLKILRQGFAFLLGKKWPPYHLVNCNMMPLILCASAR